jgi:hypothetical protein
MMIDLRIYQVHSYSYVENNDASCSSDFDKEMIMNEFNESGFGDLSDSSEIMEEGSAEQDWSEFLSSESNTDVDAALNDAFNSENGSEANTEGNLDDVLDDVFPAEEPGGLDYQPSPTGISYPDPERMEGNVGGPERGG